MTSYKVFRGMTHLGNIKTRTPARTLHAAAQEVGLNLVELSDNDILFEFGTSDKSKEHQFAVTVLTDRFCQPDTKIPPPSYEELRDALIKVLDGDSAWYEIQENTGLDEKECKDISDIYYRLLASL